MIFGGIDGFSRKVFKYILLPNFLKMSASLHVTLSSYGEKISSHSQKMTKVGNSIKLIEYILLICTENTGHWLPK